MYLTLLYSLECVGQFYEHRERFKVLILMTLAPVVKDVKPGWHDVLFNGTFLHENEFRGPAGEETDLAWESLGVDCTLIRFFFARCE